MANERREQWLAYDLDGSRSCVFVFHSLGEAEKYIHAQDYNGPTTMEAVKFVELKPNEVIMSREEFRNELNHLINCEDPKIYIPHRLNELFQGAE